MEAHSVIKCLALIISLAFVVGCVPKSHLKKIEQEAFKQGYEKAADECIFEASDRIERLKKELNYKDEILKSIGILDSAGYYRSSHPIPPKDDTPTGNEPWQK